MAAKSIPEAPIRRMMRTMDIDRVEIVSAASGNLYHALAYPRSRHPTIERRRDAAFDEHRAKTGKSEITLQDVRAIDEKAISQEVGRGRGPTIIEAVNALEAELKAKAREWEPKHA